MSALDKLRRLRDRLGAKSVASNWSQEPGHRFVRMDDVDAEIDRLLAEPETPEPGAFIWQCACGSRNVMSSAVCTKCGNGRQNSATPREPETPEPASAPANGIEIVGLPAGTIKHERTERGTVRLLFTPAPPLTGPNYLDQEEWGHERGAVSDSSWDRCVFRHADGRGVYVESADVIRGDDVPSVVRLRLTGDMGPGTVFEYEIKPDERAAVPTDAEVEDAIESFEDATHIEARHGVGAALFKEFNAIKTAARDALRALIARRVAAAEKELDEARAELAKVLKREADGVALFDELLARERAEVAQLKEKLTRWDIDYDRVHKEAKDLRAEVERLRAAAKDAAPAKETP